METPPRKVQGRQTVIVQRVLRYRSREHLLRDHPPLLKTRERELNNEPQTTDKSIIQRTLFISGQDRQTIESLYPLQQVIDLDIGISVMTILYFTPFTK